MSNQNSNQQAPSTTMIALYNFEAEDEPEISLKKGDRIEMLDMDPALNGWAYARKKNDGQEGYVPISYLGTNAPNNRSHKHSKASQNTQRSTSPLPNKSRYNDNRNNFRNNNNFQSNSNHNQNQNNPQNESESGHGHAQNAQNINVQNHNQNQNQSKQNNQQHSDVPDAKQIICSFHRDFIPEMNDLYKYFGEFGKITNKLEIEYDNKKVPLAKIKFQSASCVDKVCDKGNRQQIPSGSQNGTIHIRVYRSMQDYLSNTQRSNRSHGVYNKHKNSQRRGGF